MTIALIIAGRVGNRMGQDIPKQFLNVYDKPVIIYTLEVFQNHPNIDAIEVVCLDGWHEILRAYCKQFGITKLEGIVNGGATGQESIYNGLSDIASRHSDKEDIVLVHDSIRPMVSHDIISNAISTCRLHGKTRNSNSILNGHATRHTKSSASVLRTICLIRSNCSGNWTTHG